MLDLSGLAIRCDQTLVLDNRHHLTITGGEIHTDDPTGLGPYTHYAANTAYLAGALVYNDGDERWYTANSDFTSGSTFDATNWTHITYDPRTRCHWSTVGSDHITFSGHTVRGPHADGGTAEAAYVVEIEAQHAFNFTDTDNILVENCHGSNFYGDGVYIGGSSTGCDQVRVTGTELDHNGRQGIGATWATNVEIDHNNIHDIRRSIIDFEPNFVISTVDTVDFHDNTIGVARLSFVAGQGAQAPSNNITIRSNTVADAMVIIVNAGGSYRRSNWKVLDNVATATFGSSSVVAAMQFYDVDGVTVTGNTQPMQAGDGNYLVFQSNCTGVAVSGNTVPNGAGELYPG